MASGKLDAMLELAAISHTVARIELGVGLLHSIARVELAVGLAVVATICTTRLSGAVARSCENVCLCFAVACLVKGVRLRWTVCSGSSRLDSSDTAAVRCFCVIFDPGLGEVQ